MIKRVLLAVIAMAGVFTVPAAAAEPPNEGEIQVPLNWADPASPTIPVQYKRVPHTDRSKPTAGTIIGLHGGPAAMGSSDRLFISALGPLLADHDLIVVERRGYGKSSPLRCPNIALEQPETVSACWNDLGPRAQFFSSDQRVADVDAVRRALGVGKVTLYGFSYGTVDALAYATRYPGNTAAIVVDSTLLADRDGQIAGYLHNEMLQSELDILTRACHASPVCRAANRDPRKVVADLVSSLRLNKDISVSTIEGLLRYQQFPALGRQTVAAMSAYLAGDKAPLRRLAPHSMERRTGRDEHIRENTATMPYQCNDLALPYDRFAPVEVRSQQLAEYRRRHPERPITAADIGGSAEDFCLHWPTPRSSPPVPPNTPLPDVPALVIGGSLDVVFGANTVPLAKKFPRGQAVLVPFGRHSQSLADGCLQGLVRSFVADPDRRVRSDCTAETYRALGRFPRSSAELPRTKVPGLGVAYATAMDVLAIPTALRGGTVTPDPQRASVVLHEVRYVGDVAVSGEVRRQADGTASADLTLSTGQRMQLTWPAFEARDYVLVKGTVDGQQFTEWVRTAT